MNTPFSDKLKTGCERLVGSSFAFHEVLAQHSQLFGKSYPLHRILQIGTSVIVLPFILWMSLHYYKTHQQYLAVSVKIKSFAWGLLLFSIFTGLFSVWDYARYISTEVWRSDLYYFTGRSINEFSQGFLITFSLGCLLFLFLDRDRRMG